MIGLYVMFSILSGILHALSLPGFNLEFLSFLYLVPLIKVIRKSSPLMGGIYSGIYFASAMFFSHFWLMSTLMKNFSTLLKYKPILGFFTFLLFLLYESLFFFVFGFLASLFKDKISPRIYQYLFIPALYTFIDYLRSLGDLAYTGGMISDAFYKNTLVLFLISIVGSYGVEFIVVAINSFFSERSVKNILLILGILYLIFYIGNVVYTPALPKNGTKLELIQTNYDPLKRYSGNPSSLDNTHEFKSIVVTPEAYYSVYPVKIEDLKSLPEGAFIGTAIKEDGKFYNSVVYKENGKVQVYSKVRLFPFAEFLPYPKLFRFLSFLKKFHYYNRGEDYIPIEARGKKVGVLICFETFFEEGVINYAKKDVDFIVVSTNDGWFNSKIALWQHFAKAAIRAAESGRWIVQVANKGITGVVDSYGRIREILPVGEELRKGVAVGKPHRTIYSKIHLTVPFVLIGLLALSFVFCKKERRIKVSKSRF